LKPDPYLPATSPDEWPVIKSFSSFDTTAHEVRQRARCHNCGVKGNTTYQIVYTGNSDVAMGGAGLRSNS
jgi:hypothetical protein